MKATAKHTAPITYSICACIHYARYAGAHPILVLTYDIENLSNLMRSFMKTENRCSFEIDYSEIPGEKILPFTVSLNTE